MTPEEITQHVERIQQAVRGLDRHQREEVDQQPGRLATLQMLNAYDNPRFFHGECVQSDDHRQLWRFPVGRGWRYAQRLTIEHNFDFVVIYDKSWTSDAEDFDGWNMAGSVGVPA